VIAAGRDDRWRSGPSSLPSPAHAWLAAVIIPLTEDEAYYRLWAQHLRLGYFDHPPMVAWWIAVGQGLAGPSQFGIRLLPVLSAGAASLLALCLGSGSRSPPCHRLARVSLVQCNNDHWPRRHTCDARRPRRPFSGSLPLLRLAALRRQRAQLVAGGRTDGRPHQHIQVFWFVSRAGRLLWPSSTLRA